MKALKPSISLPLHHLAVLLILGIVFANTKSLHSQTINDYGFSYWPDLNVTSNAIQLANPWAGGLNNVQLGEIDLNHDGTPDIVAFDKHGGRLLPFVWKDDRAEYIYAPEYVKFFPPVNSLFQLHDYNGDQKPDIFTYTTGGIMVYKNVTETDLKFQKAVKQFVTSLQGDIFTNLLITNVDYPSIKDLDGDGDLDILTFWGLGSFMELHRNMSVETYGHADSLLYHKTDYCWGRFAEHPESNSIILDTCVDITSAERHDRHTGSTLCVTDIDNNGADDLILGDVDYMNLQALMNRGTSMAARMTAVVDSFPENLPVSLASFPLVHQIDLYNDDIPDLIVSPFDPGLYKSAGENSVWVYTKSNDRFELKTRSFLQSTMIDAGAGSYPLLANITDDDLPDLLVGNYGTISNTSYNNNGQLVVEYVSKLRLYKNTGTKTVPSFTLIADDLAGFGSLGLTALIPAIADFNNDKLKDLLVGTADGKLLLYFGSGFENSIPEYHTVPLIITDNASVKHLAPAPADIDNDGLTDIISGKQDGKLSYYHNTGTPESPSFQLITDSYGQINVTQTTLSYTGHSTPFIYNHNGKLHLFVGSESGRLFYYPSLPVNPDDTVYPEADVFDLLQDGIRSSLCLADLNADAYPELVTGNYSGGLKLYKGKKGEPQILQEGQKWKESLNITPNPATGVIRIALPKAGAWQISVTDTYGNQVMDEEVKGTSAELSVESLRSGIYIAVASQQSTVIAGKFIIIR